MLRIICSVVSVRLRDNADRPFINPKTRPIVPPIMKPDSARTVLMAILCSSSPDSSNRQKASATADGGAIVLAEIQPARLAISHRMIKRAGSIQPDILPETMRLMRNIETASLVPNAWLVTGRSC